VNAADALQVARLKVKAREARRRFEGYMDTYDCGAAMLKEINPGAAEAAHKYNDAMTELRRLDPKCPEFTPL
jgi:hypothetical protein